MLVHHALGLHVLVHLGQLFVGSCCEQFPPVLLLQLCLGVVPVRLLSAALVVSVQALCGLLRPSLVKAPVQREVALSPQLAHSVACRRIQAKARGSCPTICRLPTPKSSVVVGRRHHAALSPHVRRGGYVGPTAQLPF